MLRKSLFLILFVFCSASACQGRMEIEGTDLSSVTLMAEREVIEEALGTPKNLVSFDGGTVAIYSINAGYRGHYQPSGFNKVQCDHGACLPVFLVQFMTASAEYAGQIAQARASQKKEIIIFYDTEGRIVSAIEPEITNKSPPPTKLTDFREVFESAQRGDPESQFRMFEVSILPEAKSRWLCKAAHKNNAEAQFRMGRLYDPRVVASLRAEFSIHDPKYEKLKGDPESAYLWYRLALANHAPPIADWTAERSLHSLRENMSAAQIARGEQRFSTWQANPFECDNIMELYCQANFYRGRLCE